MYILIFSVACAVHHLECSIPSYRCYIIVAMPVKRSTLTNERLTTQNCFYTMTDMISDKHNKEKSWFSKQDNVRCTL